MSKEKLKNALFKLARSNLSGLFMGFAFENLSRFIPVDKIAENELVIAFYHPARHWERHILVVPKKAIRNFLSIDLDEAQDQEMLITIYKTATEVAKKQGLYKYTVLVNGGKYQDVPQVHFHLASGKDKYDNELGQEQASKGKSMVNFESEYASVQRGLDSGEKEHLVISSKIGVASIQELNLDDVKTRAVLLGVVKTAQDVVKEIRPKGFTLLTNEGEGKTLTFHLLYER